MATKIFPPGDTGYPIDTAHVSSIEQYKEIYDRIHQKPGGVLGEHRRTNLVVQEVGRRLRV